MLRSDGPVTGALLLLCGTILLGIGPASLRSSTISTLVSNLAEQTSPKAELIWAHPATESGLLAGLESHRAVTADMLSTDELSAFRTILLVSNASKRGQERLLHRLSQKVIARQLDMSSPGSLGVWLLQPRHRFRVTGQLEDWLPSARVTTSGEDQRLACVWDAAQRRHVCPGPGFHWVGQSSASFSGNPYRCIWAHPSPRPGGVLELELPAVQLSDTLALGAGLSDHAVRKRDGAQVQISIQVGSNPPMEVRIPNARGMKWRHWPTKVGVSPLILRITTPDAAVRHLCLTLESRRRE